ncbi:MAG TPA: crosslink repair DNA glycosylase YcaQ family protein [Candidatus Angelobacter sp.]|nr:crosslink repair DNA glycosylase YcaQ family protein [Candidatus Angelobacter sp.]
MTEQELQQLRARKWHLDGSPVRTLEEAREFITDIGFCVMYPQRTLHAVPSLIGAYAGSAERLPDSKHAFADPRSKEATALMVRLLRERSAYEMSLFQGADLIVSGALFPYFYALVADRNPKASPRVRVQGATVSPLAVDVFHSIQKNGPLSKNRLRELVSRELSDAALDRALGELWSILKIVRVDYRGGEGVLWDVLYRWSAPVVKEALDISEPEAISALLSKFLEATVAASQEEIETFFSHLTSRSKIREAINALLSARELSFVGAGAKTLIRLTPVPDARRRMNG